MRSPALFPPHARNRSISCRAESGHQWRRFPTRPCWRLSPPPTCRPRLDPAENCHLPPPRSGSTDTVLRYSPFPRPSGTNIGPFVILLEVAKALLVKRAQTELRFRVVVIRRALPFADGAREVTAFESLSTGGRISERRPRHGPKQHA